METTNRVSIARLLAVFAAFFLVTKGSMAESLLDQENLPTNNAGQQVSFGNYVAQTFTVGIEGNLTEIIVHVKQNSCTPIDDLNFELYETASGRPSGSPIAFGSLSPSQIPDRFSPYGAASFSIPNIPVQVGDVLAVKLVTDAPDNGCNYAWDGGFLDPSGPYARGEAMRFFISPSTGNRVIAPMAQWDMVFQTFVESSSEGLISYWSFDDGTATDQVGTNDGIIIGGVSATGDGVDMAPIPNNSNALRFDGILSEVLVPNDPTLNFAATDSFTLSMWFKRETDRPIYHLLGKRDACSLSINYQLARDFGLLHFNWARVDANVDAPLGEWVHLATTYDGTDPATARIYVDGVLMGMVSPFALGPVVGADLKIGNSGACPDDQRFQGVIDEVRIYDRALDAQEVAALAGSEGNEAPVADAGPDQSVRVGDVVTLDGAASFDDNTATTDLLFDWTFSSLPAGSAAVLANQDTANPSFVVDVVGSYDIELTVTDGAGLSSEPDSVAVSSLNIAPDSDAGGDRLVVVGSTVTLDGSGSKDPENDPLTFSWSLSTPVGSTAQLAGPDTASPSFVADVPGVYIGTLTVSDAIGPGAPDSVGITAASPGDFAQTQIVTADMAIAALSPQSVTTQGNQTALGNFLTQATLAIQIGDVAEAIDKLEKAIARTDGCVLNGAPDGNGPGRDWVTDCAEQAVIYATLNAALEALL